MRGATSGEKAGTPAATSPIDKASIKALRQICANARIGAMRTRHR
jgi:hypothetical protein